MRSVPPQLEPVSHLHLTLIDNTVAPPPIDDPDLDHLKNAVGPYLRFAVERPTIYRQSSGDRDRCLPMLGALGDPISCLILEDPLGTVCMLIGARGKPAVRLVEQVFHEEARRVEELPFWALGAEEWMAGLPKDATLFETVRSTWIGARYADLRFFHAARRLRG